MNSTSTSDLICYLNLKIRAFLACAFLYQSLLVHSDNIVAGQGMVKRKINISKICFKSRGENVPLPFPHHHKCVDLAVFTLIILATPYCGKTVCSCFYRNNLCGCLPTISSPLQEDTSPTRQLQKPIEGDNRVRGV